MPQSRPKTPSHKTRRKSARTTLPAVECKLSLLGKKHPAVQDVAMKDIGAGGTLVSAATEIAVGTMVQCDFKLPAGGAHSLQGTVLRCLPNAERFDVAVEFNTTQANEEELMHWVLSWIGLQQRVLMGVPTPPRVVAK